MSNPRDPRDPLSSLFESIDLAPPAAPDVSRHLPVLHLDHIYYEGHVEFRVELPRTRRALMASDHLPLVARGVLR